MSPRLGPAPPPPPEPPSPPEVELLEPVGVPVVLVVVSPPSQPMIRAVAAVAARSRIPSLFMFVSSLLLVGAAPDADDRTAAGDQALVDLQNDRQAIEGREEVVRRACHLVRLELVDEQRGGRGVDRRATRGV